MSRTPKKYFCSIKPKLRSESGLTVNHGLSPESLISFSGYKQTQISREDADVGPMLIVITDNVLDQFFLHSRLQEISKELNWNLSSRKVLEKTASLLIERYPNAYTIEKIFSL